MDTMTVFIFFSSRRRHTISLCDWSSDVCSSDLSTGGKNCRKPGNPTASMKWLDFQAFCSSFLPLISRDATLEKVFYFSASADFRPDKAARHAILVAALRSTGVAVQLGRFKEKDIRCPECKTNFTRHEEKETDVAVAVKLLELLAVNACETVVLLTGDTDLAPAIRTAKTLYPDKRIWVIFPYSRHNAQLKALAHGTIQVKAKRYAAN